LNSEDLSGHSETLIDDPCPLRTGKSLKLDWGQVDEHDRQEK